MYGERDRNCFLLAVTIPHFYYIMEYKPSYEFSESARIRADRVGVDIEQSYRLLQLEVLMGGPVAQRIIMAIAGLDYKNNYHHEGRNITDHFGSTTDSKIGAEPRIANPNPTVSELRALNALIDHKTIQGAAVALNLSYHTVHDQIKNARHKLNAKNTTHAVAIVIRRGLI